MADPVVFSNTASIALTLSRPAEGEVTASWQTSDGTALAGVDYQQTTGSVIFNPGEISKTVTVPCINPTGAENKWFSIRLFSVIGAVIDPLSCVPVMLAAPGFYMKGADGSRIWQTSGFPDASLGFDGDWAFDNGPDTNGNFYQKSQGIWSLKGNAEGPKGDNGPPGPPLTNKGTWVSGATYSSGQYVFIQNADNTWSAYITKGTVDFQSNTSPSLDTDNWVPFNPASGREVNFQRSDDAIQWQYVGDTDWKNLVLLKDIKGDKGSQFIETEGMPEPLTGSVGDWALDSSPATLGDLYQKTKTDIWRKLLNLRGTPGLDGVGANWIEAAGIPSASSGMVGDWALDFAENTLGNVYHKKKDGWTQVGNLRGPSGQSQDTLPSKWIPVLGVPTPSVGNNGDWAFNTSSIGNGDVYYKQNNAWVKQSSLKGPAGDVTTTDALAKSSTNKQIVKGPVEFSGIIEVRPPSDYNSNQALPVSVAEDRYAKPSQVDTALKAAQAYAQPRFPLGFIALWYGSSSSPPTGWIICDGSNGSPDMRDKVAIGVGSTVTLGQSLGSVNQSGFVADCILTLDQIPSHSHDFTFSKATKSHGDGDTVDNIGTGLSSTSTTAKSGGGKAHSHSYSINVVQPSVGLHYIMWTGSNSGGSSDADKRVMLAVFAVSPPDASENIAMFAVTSPMYFPQNFAGSVGKCEIGPSSDYTLSVQVNSTEVGTITVGPTGSFIFTSSADIPLKAGDVVRVVCPSAADSTITGIAATLIALTS